jgi:hypothetical protein
MSDASTEYVPSGREAMTNRPSVCATAPSVVPKTRTLAPGSGWRVARSRTIPFITPFANRGLDIDADKKKRIFKVDLEKLAIYTSLSV